MRGIVVCFILVLLLVVAVPTTQANRAKQIVKEREEKIRQRREAKAKMRAEKGEGPVKKMVSGSSVKQRRMDELQERQRRAQERMKERMKERMEEL